MPSPPIPCQSRPDKRSFGSPMGPLHMRASRCALRFRKLTKGVVTLLQVPRMWMEMDVPHTTDSPAYVLRSGMTTTTSVRVECAVFVVAEKRETRCQYLSPRSPLLPTMTNCRSAPKWQAAGCHTAHS